MSDQVAAPNFVLGMRGISTQRQWRQVKRAEMDSVIEALNTFRLGCAYCPGFTSGEIETIMGTALKVREQMTQERWGK